MMTPRRFVNNVGYLISETVLFFILCELDNVRFIIIIIPYLFLIIKVILVESLISSSGAYLPSLLPDIV